MQTYQPNTDIASEPTAVQPSVREDRERIARGLHDTVLSELTGIVLAMQRARHFLPQTEQTNFDQALVGVDSILRSIRGTVHNLQRTTTLTLRDQLTQLVGHFDALLPQHLSLATSGKLPTISCDAQADLVAVLTEALTNAAKYSSAQYVDVDLTWHAGDLTLMVTDDGIGLQPSTNADPRSGNGLKSMAHRARCHNGSFELGPGYRRGTVIRWSIPVES